MCTPAADQKPPEAVTLLLVRHGMTEETGTRLAAPSAGIHRNDSGRIQCAHLHGRLTCVVTSAVMSSPLERCWQTMEAVAEQLGTKITVDERFIECDYGTWTGRDLTELATEPLWNVVQNHPSAVRFPEGVALAASSARALEAVRDWNTRRLRDGPSTPPVYVVCSQGDISRALVAVALGMHRDMCQRLRVDPGSLTSITYTRSRPFLNTLNDTGEHLATTLPTPAETQGEAVVGGGAGSSERTNGQT